MASITVSSAAALLSAISAAKSGDTIYLTPGTYSSLTIRGINIAGDVTITSQDPSHPAILQGLKVESCSGLNFSNLDCYVNPAGSIYQYQILTSSDIHLSKISFHGRVDGDPTNDLIGLRLKGNQGISVTDSTFQDLEAGIHMGANNGVTIAGNEFFNIRKDGIQDTLGSSNVLISGNYFHDFQHLEGDHSDAMQFGTYGATSSPTNIVITNNIIMQGNGASLQGIFMGNEKSIPYVDVSITNNFIYDGHYHGISVIMANGIIVSDNTVVSNTSLTTWIMVNNSTAAQITGNEASLITLNGSKITTLGNTYIGSVSDGGIAALDDWVSGTATSAPVTAQADALAFISGTAGADTILGTAAGERVEGLGGNDVLRAGAGDDVIYGGDGNDTLRGGLGSDTLWGGQGGDKFYFDSAYLGDRKIDVVSDFNSSQGDKISLSAIDARAGTTTNDAFTFIGTNAFSGVAGQLRYEVKEGNAYVYGDVNGDKLSDFTIKVLVKTSLSLGDFLL